MMDIRNVTLEEFIDIVKKDENVSFVVAYKKESADADLMAPGIKTDPIKDKLGDPVPMTAISDPLFKEKSVVVKATTIFSAYGSPGCQLVHLPSCQYVFVTWPQ